MSRRGRALGRPLTSGRPSAISASDSSRPSSSAHHANTAAAAASSIYSQPSTRELLQGGVRRDFKDPTGRVGEFSSAEDKCPICRTDRFLNPRLRLLVSPCYHKIFNKSRDEFATLTSYNNYLEEVETLTYNLIHKVDLPATEARVAAYESANKSSSVSNVRAQQAASEQQRQQESALKALQVQRARERRVRHDAYKQQLQALQESSADDIARGIDVSGRREDVVRRYERQEKLIEERHKVQDAAAALVGNAQTSTAAAPSRQQWLVESLWDFVPAPLATLDDCSWAYDLRDAPSSLGGPDVSKGYVDPWALEKLDGDAGNRFRAGGYDYSEVWQRCIRASIDGLAINTART
ncbi:Predicted E3 ubiquitin ligase containing RING finger, subunit of transcription/repair factor TFIIH and CDK-activating kinase assembly factor [Ceraceosorus bombacis]|uniref:Predicted E3 ubiquitin ligase containing RING finger, subunit of transcription/repair factor TFIIH and CDK-activating kinase assembly factor n=1 Tax=Ceraceosorus bombacis TaxID=401625 RepID=A0A0P1B7K4_9BASI|nr:Predicted E3 ubiquitin ligase containing RING finger, subunit of transcription/repair factor TFIIH and CDK-activating kinase assembly factor [Ceraceosorus bombacis]